MPVNGTWTRTAGDIGASIDARLDGITALESVVSVTGEVRRGRLDPRVELAGELVDADARTVRIELGSWLVDADQGTYDVRIVVAFGSGARWTWPSKGRAQLVVQSDWPAADPD
ncbi:hypothetical protein [Desertimonas flava]|uniref:hypothetical protein n=1 Tax=Desertimonas flava TaxID=2064846 RepID=UPI0013C4CC08|nr:hypothetical protein [Desertimonas flava]